MGINQQHAGAGDGPPLFTTVSPFAGGGNLITLIYLLALFRFFFALSGLDTGSPLRESVPVAG
ncbi:hypothetical protein ACNKHT_16090 [Shigella flexneri]